MNTVRNRSLAIVAVGLALLAGVITWNTVTRADPSDSRIVLLAHNGEIATGIPASEAANHTGLFVADLAAQLRHAVDETTEAVVFVRSDADIIGRDWLRERYLDGIVVVGVNVTRSEMERIVGGLSVNLDGPSDTTYDQPFLTAASGGCRPSSSGNPGCQTSALSVPFRDLRGMVEMIGFATGRAQRGT